MLRSHWNPTERYTAETFLKEAEPWLQDLPRAESLEAARAMLFHRAGAISFDLGHLDNAHSSIQWICARDCARVLQTMFLPRSARMAEFDMAQAVWDVACGRSRPELGTGFWAEMIHLVRGLLGRADIGGPIEDDLFDEQAGRAAALVRSDQLDAMWKRVTTAMARFEDGLSDQAQSRRDKRRRDVLNALGGSEQDWQDWRWHRDHVLLTPQALASAIRVSPAQVELVRRARGGRLPFGVTPYYASLMDDDPSQGRDRAIRAQVLPPSRYVDSMLKERSQRRDAFDFMREVDTSPADLITRRYPAIAILKPYNSCPQICVYCQRNWEIEEALAPDALATRESIDAAIDWFHEHPAMREVLLTGGDPLTMDDELLGYILGRLSQVEHLDLIRIGTRTPVTLPMRITESVADLLASYRKPGRREVVVVTHIESVYEVTPDMVAAVNRLRTRGIAVYNQHVLHFFVSRRFEASALRMLLRRIGIDPYYTFVPKGKEEMGDYRVPIARLLQERKEEARLLPGLRRTDETVYNVPRLGKNHIRALQHRDLLAIQPNGSRVYEFHPWEKFITDRRPYLAIDPPVLDYLIRMAELGEDPEDYRSIWYYY
ncbi:MAG: KamA family radical SAM protein [Bradymonadales bacterium]|nr:KamA family radical SAM protein [Bradymonadales bacterium]